MRNEGREYSAILFRALQRLNELGYGKEGAAVLNLVTNPTGAFMPGNQASLKRIGSGNLSGVMGSNLAICIQSQICRLVVTWILQRSGNLESYMEKLVTAFNPATVDGLMCRMMISVGWDGRLYDCDFNQMLEMGIEAEAGESIVEANLERIMTRRIAVGAYCYGCTAGGGSSCGGATA